MLLYPLALSLLRMSRKVQIRARKPQSPFGSHRRLIIPKSKTDPEITAAIASSSQEPPHLHEEVATQVQPLQLETPASKKPTRSRKSLSLHHISQNSSPYFTPRRSARMHSSPQPSSPKRKENLPPVSSPQRPLPSTKSVSPPPAQINGHLKEKNKTTFWVRGDLRSHHSIILLSATRNG